MRRSPFSSLAGSRWRRRRMPSSNARACVAKVPKDEFNLLNGVTDAPCLLDIIVKSAGCRGGEVKMRDIIERPFKAKWTIVLTVAITLLAMPGSAMAQDAWGLETGNDYLRLCSTALDADASGRADGLVCRGYMRGFLSGLNATQDLYVTARKQPRALCLPSTVNVDQLMRISLKYFDDHPADLRGSLVQLILVSWLDRFPCTKRP
jgi:hypothetical protein